MPPNAHLPARLVEHPVSQCDNRAGLLGYRDEEQARNFGPELLAEPVKVVVPAAKPATAIA
jgi:hypothetical protein